MSKLLDSLKEYFENTPQEKLDEDWKKLEPYLNAGPTVDEYIEYHKKITIMDCVDVEAAKMLEGKGFREPCMSIYTPLNDEEYRLQTSFPKNCYGDLCKKESGSAFDEYLAPTLYDAQKWLMNEKQIWVYVFPVYDAKFQIVDYRVRVVKYEDLIDKKKGKLIPLWFEVYEQALNEGIKCALKMI